MKRGLIYCLKCPIKNEIRYVGQTTRSIEKRLKEHKFKIEKRVNKRTNWLNQLRKIDIINDLQILVLGEYDINILDDMETKWIVFYLNEGCDLTNTTLKGGFGGYREWKEEVNKSRSEKLKDRKKKKMSKETRNKISESKKGTIPHNIKKIKQYDMDGNFIKEWDSSHEASRELNLSQGNIVTVASKSGRRKSTGGFRWEWSLDENI